MINLIDDLDQSESNLLDAACDCHLLLRFHVASGNSAKRHRLRSCSNEIHPNGIFYTNNSVKFLIINIYYHIDQSWISYEYNRRCHHLHYDANSWSLHV